MRDQRENDLVLEDHVTVVAEVESLDEDSHEGNHGQTSVVDLLVLVVNPALIGVIDPVAGSQQISGLVTFGVLDLLGEPLDGAASEDELHPSDERKLLRGLKRVVAEGAVEGWVDAGGIEVPSEAGGHGDASVLELGLAVEAHDLVGLAGGETEGIEVSHWCGDSDDGVILPRLQGGGGGSLLLGWGEGGGGADESGKDGGLHGGFVFVRHGGVWCCCCFCWCSWC
mmetsp:Transcript_14711/g.40680  ORF Transcript_14711/g.40680 Transcript_14711/m.40680 type:complete len:226 (-) Transcript_14711:42-719(-)